MSKDNAYKTISEIFSALNGVVKGQNEAAKQLVCGFISGGHVLIEGAPGVAKTLMARVLSSASGLSFKRIQFTADLLPSDIIGTKIFMPKDGVFRFEPGPVFTDVLLADEINRTPPKTQAALLEAMEEGKITVEGEEYKLSGSFFVIATQNPVEYEGTYPLPEAQTDRFMMKIIMGYPEESAELEMLKSHEAGFDPKKLTERDFGEPLKADALDELKRVVREVKVEPGVMNYILQIARRTRREPSIALGASPRAAVLMMNAAKAMAAIDSRDFIIPDDVKAIANPCLRHRLILRPEAEMDGLSPDAIIDEITASTQAPR